MKGFETNLVGSCIRNVNDNMLAEIVAVWLGEPYSSNQRQLVAFIVNEDHQMYQILLPDPSWKVKVSPFDEV